jgi:OOP family OmpA-OmpF porin
MNRNLISLASALLVGALAFTQAQAQTQTPSIRLFGDVYRPVSQAAPDQVQVVFYRAGTPVDSAGGNAANVYVDGEFHTALVTGGYTRFCVAPGAHDLAAYYGDAPLYAGKQSLSHSVRLEAGKTYFLQTGNANAKGAPVSMTAQTSAAELADNREQVHVISRASAVTACTDVPAPAAAAAAQQSFELPSDLLFAFGKSGQQDLTAAGRTAIQDLAKKLVPIMGNQAKTAVVIGHADLIGSAPAARKLSLARAQTVRTLLVASGVPAGRISVEGQGQAQPVAPDCGRTRTEENIFCNAPNRRVSVRIQ